MLDVGDAPALDPVLIDGVLVGFPERRPEHSQLLRFAPRNVLVSERAHEALDGLHAFVAARSSRARAGNEASAFRRRHGLDIEALPEAVPVEELQQLLAVVRAIAQVRHHPAAVLRVDDRRARRNAFARVAAGLAHHQRAPHDPRHEIDLGGFRHRLVHRARDELAFARAEAIEQRSDEREGKLLAGDVIRVPHLRRDRRQVVLAARIGVVAAIHHDAAEREMNQVRRLEIRPRTVIAERRHARMDQRGEFLRDRILAHAELVELALRRGFEQDVGARDERAEAVVVLLLLEIEHERFLAAVVIPEEERALGTFLVFVERPDLARGVAAGRLDLDDLGAQPRERQPAVLRLLVGELDDANAGERPRTLLLCCHGDPLFSRPIRFPDFTA